jgi:transposase-like protein
MAVSQEVHSQIIGMYDGGAKSIDIAGTHGVSVRSVQRIVKWYVE